MWSVPATRMLHAPVRKMLSHGWHAGTAAARMVVEVLCKIRWDHFLYAFSSGEYNDFEWVRGGEVHEHVSHF